MARRKEPVIPDAILDQLLSGGDAKSAFAGGGLIDQLKKALAERGLNAEMDEARDRLDDGKITHKELEKMKGELTADMPDTVREKLGLEQPKTDAGPKAVAEKPAMPANMDSLMQKTGFTPAP